MLIFNLIFRKSGRFFSMKDFFEFFVKTYYNSNYISFHLRKIIEKINFRKVLGLQLTSTMFVAGVLVPQAHIISSAFATNQLSQTTLLAQNTTQVTFAWPLNTYQISQNYRFYHPAIDLTISLEDPVLAIADGAVETTVISNWGYGKHIIIRHDNGYLSLYAHLSKIFVKAGDRITQGFQIGTVGISGWSTGPHLHFEIRGPEGSLNPLEVLPSQETQAATKS